MLYYFKNCYGKTKAMVVLKGKNISATKYKLCLKYGLDFTHRQIRTWDFFGIILPVHAQNPAFYWRDFPSKFRKIIFKEDVMPRYVSDDLRTVKKSFTIPKKYSDYVEEQVKHYQEQGDISMSQSRVMTKILQFYITAHGLRLSQKEFGDAPLLQEEKFIEPEIKPAIDLLDGF